MRKWMPLPSEQLQQTRRSSLQRLQMLRRAGLEQVTQAPQHSIPGPRHRMQHPGAAVQ